MKIAVQEFQELFELVLGAISSDGVVEVPQDFYWSVPPSDQYDSYSEPSLTVGQLTADLDQLRAMREADVFTEYGGVWLGELLRAASYAAVNREG